MAPVASFASSSRVAARPSCRAPVRQRVVARRAEGEDKNPLEQAGDKIKEVGQKFADAQKMPDLGEEANELTKDGLFYTASNDNKLESDKDVRSGVVDTDKLSPDVPFSENQSKGENPGSDSTKPSIADNVKEALGGGDS